MNESFEYQPQEGVLILWHVTVSGFDDDDLNGDFDSQDTLGDVEHLIENFEDEYRDDTDASLTRVRGAHGWREFEWNNGAIHRYEWKHFLLDLRCPICHSPDNDLYMVHDLVWHSSGLDGLACFRCLERAIGRQLTPDDFDPGVPANDGRYTHHGPELRQRIRGLKTDTPPESSSAPDWQEQHQVVETHDEDEVR